MSDPQHASMPAHEKEVIAFLGPKASYTHQAAMQTFPPASFTLVALTTIEDVFAAVQAGTASRGVVPFENSSNGPVVFTLDLFADTNHRYPDIRVHGEIYLPVHHCLLGRAPRTATSPSQTKSETLLPARPQLKLRDSDLDSPLVSGQVTPTQATPSPAKARVKPAHSLRHVRKLYSHPQAWGQCKVFLAAYLKHAERQDVSSTSRAAELVASEIGEAESESGDEGWTTAAISSRIAADLNGLDVLAEGIEDNEGNCTRFFVLRKGPAASTSLATTSSSPLSSSTTPATTEPQPAATTTTPPTSTPATQDSTDPEFSNYKTLLTFTIDHTAPGALADSLAVFKKHRLNLTSINTRPKGGGAAWEYIFFVELMGRRVLDGDLEEGGASGGAVNAALGDLARTVKTWRWVGSWERAGIES